MKWPHWPSNNVTRESAHKNITLFPRQVINSQVWPGILGDDSLQSDNDLLTHRNATAHNSCIYIVQIKPPTAGNPSKINILFSPKRYSTSNWFRYIHLSRPYLCRACPLMEHLEGCTHCHPVGPSVKGSADSWARQLKIEKTLAIRLVS